MEGRAMIDRKELEQMEPYQIWCKYNDVYLLMYGLVFFLTIHEGAGFDALKQSMKDEGASDFLLESLDRIYRSAKEKFPEQ
jgi:hypothetical protein